MEQFKTAIKLDQAENAGYMGKILMYIGENSEISFYIAAKETSFKGRFDESDTELSGNFLFPDNSKHPLTVKKFENDSLTVDGNAPSFKYKIRDSFRVEELKSDLHDMIKKLKEYHPRLHAYTSETAFKKEVEEVLESLHTQMNLEPYYFKVAPLVASVKCSNTVIRLPEAYKQQIQDILVNRDAHTSYAYELIP